MNRPAKVALPPPVLIETTEALASLCDRLAAADFVTVDTEFMRERTYWPELCVIQIAGPEDVAVIDAQAEGLDLAPLYALFDNPAVTKVFHAARQDIEIFVLRTGRVPAPLFDTQVAAMVAGFGDQVGYDALVGALTGAVIDKAFRFSDWSARPLTAQQIAYAAADVTHLRRVYTKLRARLEREGRLDWVAEEMAALADPATYRTAPEDAWLRLRSRSGNRRFLAVLRAVAAWREREAQRINIPRQRLVKDETLLEIAAQAPADAAGLARARGFPRSLAEGKAGAALLAAIAEAKALPDDALPPAPERNGMRPSPALVALLKVLLAAKCDEHHVAQRLVASADDIERLASEDEPDIPALHGWRRRVFGEDALALKGGRVALAAEGRRIRLVPLG
ncbi:ribonuclease D [Elioraea sp. Yellowstone]|jgi:ribonuclease D|uniref:ribonuclease D n=1 Tax=Elioraea sp. Yellowstone TaxID=2592070 RepID=UPI00114E4478|nr:ribonuclease D [Elioraea sp. Yellowstone]TQF85286.1 ribonuclease D [Elioraea sp. Yellowstone]